jgi:hypothetical protein
MGCDRLEARFGRTIAQPGDAAKGVRQAHHTIGGETEQRNPESSAGLGCAQERVVD